VPPRPSLVPPPSRPPATLKAVAQAAQVHPSTVSRALGPETRHLVAPEVARRIEEIADTLGYRPDRVAASLRTGRSGLIGVVLPDVANPVFGPILRGVETTLAENDYVAIVANAPGGATRVRAVVAQLIARRVDGLVLATAELDDGVVDFCLTRRVPVVLVNRGERVARVPTIVPDDERGMRLGVEHLIGLGHRAIGFIGGPASISTGALRRLGFERAMADAGLDASAVELAGAYTREAGRAAANALLDRHRLTAIAAGNDLLALGAYGAASDHGMRVPQDLSIVGHNDMPLVDMVEPGLTTVRISHDELGVEAALALLARINDADGSAGLHMTEPLLIERGSTAAPTQR